MEFTLTRFRDDTSLGISANELGKIVVVKSGWTCIIPNIRAA